MAERRGRFILIAGPDGSGKSTVADAIVERASAEGLTVTRAHHRPGLIAGRPSDAGPVTDPHGEPARSTAASAAKLLVVFADHVLGGNTRWRSKRRAGVLLLERGWFDMTVDPLRYRMSESIVPLVRVLGRLLPRPDALLLLSGDANALHARKPEIGVEEVARQIEGWRRIAPVAARRVVEVDTVRTEPDDAVDALSAAMRSPRVWRRVPCTPGRIDLRVTGDARPGLAIYQPQSVRARAASIAWRTARIRGRVVGEPIAHLGELWRMIGVTPDGVAAMRSSTSGRSVMSMVCGGEMDLVVKIGPTHDMALRHEAEMLTARLRPGLPVGRPELTWAGEWGQHFVLVTRAAQRSSSTAWTLQEVFPLAKALARAGTDGAALTHGDLAPWNLVRTANGPVLLDWESARWADEPLHDLAHFVVQDGALLGRYAPDQAVALLCDEGSPGAMLLQERGLAREHARPLLVEYLAQATPTDPRAVRFRAEMLRLVNR